MSPGESSESTERLHGAIERVTFHSEETGYCVLRVKVPGRRELATVVGRAATVGPGEYVECRGAWIRDPKHGMQFRADRLQVVPPSTTEGIEKYLSSGMVRGIGPHFAKRLVKAFGERVFDVIEFEPEKLTRLPGIGPKRAAAVRAGWAEQKVIRDIMVFLQSHGLGTARAVRIYKTYGEDAVATVSADPYSLALDVHGIGFKVADDLAARLGIAKDAPIRARAALRHVLQERAASGHCAVVRDELEERTSNLLEVDAAIVRDAVESEVDARRIVLDAVGDDDCVWLAPLHQAEVGVSQGVARLLPGAPPWGIIDASKAIPWVEQRTGMALSESQTRAVELALASKVTVITGGPGVGKTTLVNSLLQIVRAKRAQVELCAPTGRAAKRMTETTGIDARTIHRLLEFDPRRGGFKRGMDRPLETDLVVLDEASMVDVSLMNALLRAVPERAAMWIVGDVDQIPSVGPGAILADLIRSRRVPTVRLTEIFRQAAASRIVVNAHRIQAGDMPLTTERDGESDFYFVPAETPEDIAERLVQVVTERIPRRFRMHPVRDVQVLTPMNRGSLGTRTLNVDLQRILNPGASPRVERFGQTFARGDKVVQTVNDYDKDVFNGDIGTVTAIDLQENGVVLRFDDRDVPYALHELDEVSLAYATTIHKAQGSEYPAVVMPLSTQHYTMLERNLLYTGVTRGRRLVVLIGQHRALAVAVRNARSKARLTALADRLAAAVPLPA